MEEPNLTTIFATAAVSGVIAHQILFRRVEVDTHPLLIFFFFLGAPLVVSFILQNYSTCYAEFARSLGFLLVATFLLSLGTSILVYRAFFHPLHKFPGPFRGKLTKLWALTQAAKTGLRWYHVDYELHKKYGDYVRTGKVGDYNSSEEKTKII